MTQTLWQTILSDYGSECYLLSFSELADEYGTTERAIGRAMAALKRRRALCATIEYSDGRELRLSTSLRRRAAPKPRHRCPCSR